MIETLSHITFIVADVRRTADLFRTVFDAKEVYDSSEINHSLSYEKFFVLGSLWIAIMEGKPLAERSYNHVAFKIPDAEFDEYAARVRQLGLEILPGRERCKGEARSLYFFDYDNHLFELHTGTLRERLLSYTDE